MTSHHDDVDLVPLCISGERVDDRTPLDRGGNSNPRMSAALGCYSVKLRKFCRVNLTHGGRLECECFRCGENDRRHRNPDQVEGGSRLGRDAKPLHDCFSREG